MLVLGDSVDLRTVLHVVDVDRRIMESELSGCIVETIPTWCSILIHFDIGLVGPIEFGERLDRFMSGVEESGALTLDSRLVTLPVLYGGAAGPDLDVVAAANRLSVDETIRRLAEGTHFVGMISFIPGQANCMWLEPELVLTAPKYAQPRTYTPEGTIGLGGSSIAIYSVPSPGGFQMVGRMPVPTYSPYPILPAFESSPILLRVGDRLRLKSIDRAEYDAIAQAVREGTYRYEIEESRLTVDAGTEVMSGGSP
jgi:KipI family sensor histidine kinase inhibitor